MFGLRNSGIHALGDYLKKFFDVQHPPMRTKKSRGDGLFEIRNWKLWKHHVPFAPMALPTRSAAGLTTVLLTVRNIVSRLCSMLRNGYELHLDPQVKRRRHALSWFLRKVQLRTQETNYPQSLGTLMYSTAVDLWFQYIRGYLSGFLAPGNQPIRAVVVRQEDLFRRPRELVDALQRFGLRRNGIAFRIIENLQTGYAGMSRASNLLQEQKDSEMLARTAPIQKRISTRLVDLGCAPYIAAVGYAIPQQIWSAEHTEAARPSVHSNVSGRSAAVGGAAAAAAGATTTPPVEADSDITARETPRRDGAAATTQSDAAMTQCDAVVAKTAALRR